MSDEIDPGLRRLFAATAEEPADEAFVVAVSGRTSRLRRLTTFGWGLALVLAAVALATLAAAFGAAIGRAAPALVQVGAVLAASPVGWAAALALTAAGAVCARALFGWRAG